MACNGYSPSYEEITTGLGLSSLPLCTNTSRICKPKDYCSGLRIAVARLT
ncbi:MAG: hypothetical protein ACP5E5_15495 [Acidobacteriaceae bacterium]